MEFALLAVQLAVALIFPITPDELARNRALFWCYWGFGFTVGLITALVQIAFFIIIVRNYYLDEPAARVRNVFGATLGRLIVLSLIMMDIGIAIMLPIRIIGGIALQNENFASRIAGFSLYAIGILAYSYIMSRWITWIVSPAVDQPQQLGEAWNATRTARFKIFADLLILSALSFFVLITLAVGTAFLLHRLGQTPLPGQVTIGALIATLLQFAFSLFVFTALSVYVANVFRQTRPAG